MVPPGSNRSSRSRARSARSSPCQQRVRRSAIFAEPLVAVAVIMAFLVTTAALTLRLFAAVSVAAPLAAAAAALPSIWAFTLTLLPAVALNAAPEVMFVTA